MDPAVALVQAYLQLNGYLTVAEFPITGASGGDGAITDIDVIGLRFPHARPLGAGIAAPPDGALGVREDGMDLLICEVKEGKARFNRNLRRQETLTATLERVGCCPADHVPHHVSELLRYGEADMTHAAIVCRARLAIFAGRPGDQRRAPLAIPLQHAVRTVRSFLRDHDTRLHGVRLTQPALAYMALLQKLDAPDGPSPSAARPVGASDRKRTDGSRRRG